MHPLHNGSQVTERPARKTTSGTMGYFSESNENGAPSYPGADFFNDQIDEFISALAAAGVTYDPTKTFSVEIKSFLNFPMKNLKKRNKSWLYFLV